MELAVCAFKGLCYSFGRFYNIKTLEKVCIYLACITDKADNCLIFSLGNVGLHALCAKPPDKALYLGIGHTGLKYCYHFCFLSDN